MGERLVDQGSAQIDQTFPQREEQLQQAYREKRLALYEQVVALRKLGYYLAVRGNYREAETLALRELAIRERQLGSEHLALAFTLESVSDSISKRTQGREKAIH